MFFSMTGRRKFSFASEKKSVESEWQANFESWKFYSNNFVNIIHVNECRARLMMRGSCMPCVTLVMQKLLFQLLRNGRLFARHANPPR